MKVAILAGGLGTHLGEETSILKQKYPEYTPYVSRILNDNCGYFCLNFTMKKV